MDLIKNKVYLVNGELLNADEAAGKGVNVNETKSLLLILLHPVLFCPTRYNHIVTCISSFVNTFRNNGVKK